MRCSTWNISRIICDFKHKYKTVNLILKIMVIICRETWPKPPSRKRGCHAPADRARFRFAQSGAFDPISGGPGAITPADGPRPAASGSKATGGG